MKLRLIPLTMLMLAGTAFHAVAQTQPSTRQPVSYAPPPMLGPDPMQLMDTDKNGTVTQEEFLRMPLKHFKEKDKNGDGVLSKEEFKIQMSINMPPLAPLPKNGDFKNVQPPMQGMNAKSLPPSQKAAPR